MCSKLEENFFLKGRRIIYLSPHFDDLAYSNGGLMAKRLDFEEFTVLNIFTRSLYAPNVHETKVEQISAIRDQEDARYCLAYQIKRINLGFGDSSCRGYDDMQELNTDPEKDPVFVEVETAIKSVLENYQCDVIFCPLAIGSHVDHLMVFRTIKSAKSEDLVKLFYEDIPYCMKFTKNEIEEIVSKKLQTTYLFHLDIGMEISRKLEDMKIYVSQTEEEDLNAAYSHARRLGTRESDFCERLWLSYCHDK
jgi:LmbE family N-acetylglucosaminyl deacetylase